MLAASIDTLAVARLRGEVASLRFHLALRRLGLALKLYNPDQPRVPSGNPDGGQWTDGVRVAQSGPGRGWARGVLARFPEATPGQAARLAATESIADRAVEQVRQFDPSWQPTRSLRAPNDIETAIAGSRSDFDQANARMAQLRGRGDVDLIHSYRLLQGSQDLFGNPTWPADKGTVAIATFDDRSIVGVNSAAPGYTLADRIAADRMRATLIRDYPDVMSTTDIGCIPNDALYHAETTALLRSAKTNGGTLVDKNIDIVVDRRVCESCERVLPLLGLSLDNPSIGITDRLGRKLLIRDGTLEK